MEPKRLLDTEGELGARVLRAGLSVPAPPAGSLSRALAAVGLPAGPELERSLEPQSHAGPLGASGAPGVTALALAKYVLGGTVGGLLLGVVATGLTAGGGRSPATPSRAASARSASPPASVTNTPLGGVDTTGAPTAAPRARVSAPPARATTETFDTSLAEEVKLLDRASAALSNGSPPQCLALLDEYRVRFPGGQLEPEASLLRVRAEVSAGNRERARQLAEALLARSGTGAFAARVRAAAGMPPDPEKFDGGPIKP